MGRQRSVGELRATSVWKADKLRGLGVALVLLAGVPSVALAAPDAGSSQARVLFEEGMKEYNLGEFDAALQAFKKAYLAKPDPVLLYNVGQCHRMLGNPKESAYAYRRYLGAVPGARNRVEVEAFIRDAEEELRRRSASAPPTEIMAPRENAPADAHDPTQPALEPAPAAAPAPALVMAPAPEPQPQPQRKWIWGVVAGVGAVVVAGVVVGAVVATAPAPAGPMPTGGTLTF